MYASASTSLYVVWWHASGQVTSPHLNGSLHISPHLAASHRISPHLATSYTHDLSRGQGPWVWAIHDTALESRFGGINELNHSCAWLSAHMAGGDGHDAHGVDEHMASTHSTILIDCLVLALIASFTLTLTHNIMSTSMVSNVLSTSMVSKKCAWHMRCMRVRAPLGMHVVVLCCSRRE